MTSKKYTVMIVEDEEDIRETLKMLLEMEGYGTLTASHGQEALSALEKRGTPPDLILLDLMMPVMNGWEFLEARNASPVLHTVPVVVVSAAGDKAATVRANAFVRKPIELDSFLELIRNFCPVGAA